MTREDKRAYNYARDRLANDDYPVYSDEYELKLAYKAGIEDAKNHPHWISVEDELPEDGIRVVAANKAGAQDIRFRYHGKWYSNFGNEYTDVTFWYPLPEMPVLSNSEKTGKDLKGGEE